MSAINVKIELSDQTCGDILCAALEGGIGYWAVAQDIKRTEDEDWNYLSATLTDAEEDEDWKYVVDYDAIRRGVERLLDSALQMDENLRGAVFTSVLCPNSAVLDAEIADCIVQAACFNKLVYG